MSTQASNPLSDLMTTTQKTPPPPQNSLGKKEFLKLLITQLKNQDPMDPLKDKDFIAQLAQFSSLEQLQNMNDGLEKQMSSDLLMAQSISNAMVTTLIGKQVTIATDQVELQKEGGIKVEYQADQAAKNAVFTVYDSNGRVVLSRDLGPVAAGQGSYSWDGKDGDGNRLPAGAYRIEVNLVSDGGDSHKAQTFIQGPVTAVKYTNGAAALEVNGQLFNISDVVEVTLGK